MPLIRLVYLTGALALSSLLLAWPAAAQSDDCVEVRQPNPEPPPSEITVGVTCPGDRDQGSGPDDGTPVSDGGGGGDGGPACEWRLSEWHESEIRNGGEHWVLYRYECDDGTSGETWLCQNCGGPEDEPEPDWEEIRDGLLLEATATLDLPSPRLRHLYDSAPDGQVLGVVGAESWWWTDVSEPVTARAEDGPLWVEVTAQPQGLEVDPGDGSPSLTCPTGGTRYDFGRSYYDQVGGSDCFHVYERTSAAQPDETYTVTATVRWTLTWVAGGPLAGAGTLPADTTIETVALPVGEIQSVVSR
ncbi:hypothetical protein [Nitriliruptor alkaliphilus]|uniref:hypothetical protein n=1 Tax=Nitriliruptor alkaliphilus TaxID=427918 RepID=UPI00069682D6|nr:hypothetical protein [Nitriliruptor alkaliphilus]